MHWAQAALLATGSLYAAAVAWLLVGLRRRPRRCHRQLPPVSIIVPARNEAGTIQACVEALRAQDYRGRLEIVVVDDRSTDTTAQRVRDHVAADNRVRLLHAPDLPRFRCPKKSALAWGIEHSDGELILCTDADCRPPATWVRSMVEHFDLHVGLVAGHARPDRGCRFRQWLLGLDNLAVGALAAGSFGMRRPLSATGRNLAYRRRLYEEVGGFGAIGHLMGGDDVYFVRLVARLTAWTMVFNARQEAVVACSAPPERWKDIVQQKLRHAGKAGHYGGGALLLGAGIYLFHVVLAVSLVRLVQGGVDGITAGVWIAKMMLDGALTGSMAGMTQPGDRRLLLGLPVLELAYLPYTLLFTLIGRLGWYRWKT